MLRFSLALLVPLALVTTCRPAAADDVKHDGTIVKVDKDHLIVKEKDKQEMTIYVGTDTKITQDGKPAKLADLRTGEPAALVYKQEGQKLQAVEIHATHGQASPGAYLGVLVEPLHPGFWAHLRDVLERQQGLVVAQVASDSPAQEAGIKAHDILLTFGDQKLYSSHQFHSLVQNEKSGQQVKLEILRDGKKQDITVTLGQPRHMATAVHPLLASGRDGGRPAWTSFDSLLLKRLGDGRFKVEIDYKGDDGKIEHRAFEGTREEIRQGILAQKNMPESEREDLLRTLAMPNS